jgi:hypothetical protein
MGKDTELQIDNGHNFIVFIYRFNHQRDLRLVLNR